MGGVLSVGEAFVCVCTRVGSVGYEWYGFDVGVCGDVEKQMRRRGRGRGGRKKGDG